MRDAPGARCARRRIRSGRTGSTPCIGGAGTWIGCASFCTAAITGGEAGTSLELREPPRQPGRAECDRGRHGQPSPWQGPGGRRIHGLHRPTIAVVGLERLQQTRFQIGRRARARTLECDRSQPGGQSHLPIEARAARGAELRVRQHGLPDERRRAISRDLEHQILAFPARHAQLLELRRFGPGCFAGSCVTAAPPCLVPAWDAAPGGSAADNLVANSWRPRWRRDRTVPTAQARTSAASA